MLAENQTKPTNVSVDDFLDSVPDPIRRSDGKALKAMMERISGFKAQMWGPTLIGFGKYRYLYQSGHGGEAPRIGFSPRGRELVLYLLAGFEGQEALIDRLGPHRATRSCLYVKRLEALDPEVLEEMIRNCLDHMNTAYPET